MLNKKIMVSCKIFAAHFGDFFELQALEDESFAVLKERIATSLRQVIFFFFFSIVILKKKKKKKKVSKILIYCL